MGDENCEIHWFYLDWLIYYRDRFFFQVDYETSLIETLEYFDYGNNLKENVLGERIGDESLLEVIDFILATISIETREI